MLKLLPPPRTIEVAAAAALIGCSLAAASATTERPSLPRVEAYYERLKQRPPFQQHIMRPLS